MNSYKYDNHVGDLLPLTDNENGYASYYIHALRPTLYGRLSVLGKAMVVYEDDDDYGLGGSTISQTYGTVGEAIACCNIKEVAILFSEDKSTTDTFKGRGLIDDEADEEDNPDIIYLTPDEYKERFGEEFDPDNFVTEG